MLHEIFHFLNDKGAVLSLGFETSTDNEVSMTQNELHRSKKWEEVYDNFA